MKKNLLILGAGPRGIATAIQALQYKDKFNIYLIDPQPISTWKFPNMVVDMKMRSPITFDLVTYYNNLEEFSLSKFLGKNTKRASQQAIEINTTFCMRKEFVEYLNYCINLLVKEGVTLLKREPIEISKEEIKFANKNLKYDYLIIATGKKTEEAIIPNYVKGLNIKTCKDIYTEDWDNKTVYVIGSGQFSAEIVDHLTSNIRAKILWVTKYNQKIKQYPIPSYKEWKQFSALSKYYYLNKNIDLNGQEYLTLVKRWGPTLTPYINEKLESKKEKFGIINPKKLVLNKENIYVLALGRKQNIYKLPFNFRFPNSYYRENTPLVNKQFSNYKYPNIYFTGQLAIEAGGPQQGSIISSGFTGEVIVKSILSSF